MLNENVRAICSENYENGCVQCPLNALCQMSALGGRRDILLNERADMYMKEWKESRK